MAEAAGGEGAHNAAAASAEEDAVLLVRQVFGPSFLPQPGGESPMYGALRSGKLWLAGALLRMGASSIWQRA